MGAAADRVKQKFFDQCSHGNSARKTNLSRCFFIIALYCCGKLAEIHHRQPLVLAAGTKMQWLGGTADQAANYCEIAPASWFNWYRVTPDVGKAGIDHPGLVTSLEGDALLPVKPDQGDLFG